MLADHLGDGAYGVARFTAIAATVIAISMLLRARWHRDRPRRAVLMGIAALLGFAALRIYLDPEPVAEAADRFDLGGFVRAVVGWPVGVALAGLAAALLMMAARERRRATGF